MMHVVLKRLPRWWWNVTSSPRRSERWPKFWQQSCRGGSSSGEPRRRDVVCVFERKTKNRDPPSARRPVFVRVAFESAKEHCRSLTYTRYFFLIYCSLSLYLYIFIYTYISRSFSLSLRLPIRIWSAIDRFVRAWDVILSMCNFLTSGVRTRMDFRCTNRGFLSESARNFSIFSVRSFLCAKEEGKKCPQRIHINS